MTSDGWKPVFTVWLDEGVVFQKGNEYKAMKLTSFNQMISDGWSCHFLVMLENGVAFKKKLKTKPIIISNSCLNAERKDKKTQSYSDVPKNLKSLPKGLDPSMVAKLFFNFGTVEKNHAVWVDLLCDDLFDSKEKKELVERANDCVEKTLNK